MSANRIRYILPEEVSLKEFLKPLKMSARTLQEKGFFSEYQ